MLVAGDGDGARYSRRRSGDGRWRHFCGIRYSRLLSPSPVWALVPASGLVVCVQGLIASRCRRWFWFFFLCLCWFRCRALLRCWCGGLRRLGTRWRVGVPNRWFRRLRGYYRGFLAVFLFVSVPRSGWLWKVVCCTTIRRTMVASSDEEEQ